MSFVSYAENFEDVLLWRALRHVGRGFYIDVGAASPLLDSVTQAFYERGWHGVNLEPAPSHQQQLCIARPADINLAQAAGAASAQCAFFELPGTPLSTLDAEQARQYSAAGHSVLRRQAEVVTLNQVCAAHAAGPIHFLKVDANGAEEAVMAGLDLQRWRPWIVLIHAAPGACAPLPGLQAAGYTLAYADGLNQFYVAPEQAGLLGALCLPPHPADDFVLCENHRYSHPIGPLLERAAAAEAAGRQACEWAEAHVREWKQKEHDREAGLRAVAALDAMAARALSAEAQHAELNARAAQAEMRVAQTEMRTAQAEMRAAQAETAVAILQGSRSWRVTRPLRGAKTLSGRALRGGRSLPQRLRGAMRRAAKAGETRIVRFIVTHPALALFARRQIARLPFLLPLARALVLRMRRSGDQAAAGASASASAGADLSQMPETARQVLDDLRRLRRNSPHS